MAKFVSLVFISISIRTYARAEWHIWLNRPFPSSKKSHFQNEAKCETFVVKMSFICIIIKNHFHINSFALSLSFKARFFGTRKWPILDNLKRPPYCFWYVRMRSGSKWPKTGPQPCAYAYVDSVFTSQGYDIRTSTSLRTTNLSVFLVLMLMSTQFSLAYTCACACAYALVKTRL